MIPFWITLGLPMVLGIMTNVTIASEVTNTTSSVLKNRNLTRESKSLWYPVSYQATTDHTTSLLQSTKFSTTTKESGGDGFITSSNELEEVSSRKIEKRSQNQRKSNSKSKSKKRTTPKPKRRTYSNLRNNLNYRTNSRSPYRYEYRLNPYAPIPYFPYTQRYPHPQQLRRRPSVRPLIYDFDDYYDYFDERRRIKDYAEYNSRERLENFDSSEDGSKERANVENEDGTTETTTVATTETTTQANVTETTTPWHGYFYGYGPSHGHEHVSITYAPWQNGGGQYWQGQQDIADPAHFNEYFLRS